MYFPALNLRGKRENSSRLSLVDFAEAVTVNLTTLITF